MTDVEFFFDPSCPWTWVTSRWLAAVAPERQLQVTWRTWSLPMKNAGRELPADMPAEWRKRILAGKAFSIQALRVLEAVGAKEGPEVEGHLYTELGRRFHHEGEGESSGSPEDVITQALAAAGLPAELADAAADDAWDEPVRNNMDEVRRQVGDEVGVPILAIRDGEHLLAMAGPIMAEVPVRDRSLALWDAVATIIGEPAVFELKRQRTASPSPPSLDTDARAVAR